MPRILCMVPWVQHCMLLFFFVHCSLQHSYQKPQLQIRAKEAFSSAVMCHVTQWRRSRDEEHSWLIATLYLISVCGASAGEGDVLLCLGEELCAGGGKSGGEQIVLER